MLLLFLFCLAFDPSTGDTKLPTASKTTPTSTVSNLTPINGKPTGDIIQLPSDNCSYTESFGSTISNFSFNYTFSTRHQIYGINFCADVIQELSIYEIIPNMNINSTIEIYEDKTNSECKKFDFQQNVNGYIVSNENITLTADKPYIFNVSIGSGNLTIKILCQAPTDLPNSNKMSSTPSTSSSKLSDGEITGITIGGVVAVVLIATVVVSFV